MGIGLGRHRTINMNTRLAWPDHTKERQLNSKPRLAIDMDEVMADTHAALADWQAENHGYAFTEAQLQSGSLRSLVSHDHAKAMHVFLHKGEIFRDFPVMPGAQDAIKRLTEKFDVFIVTAAMEYPASCAFKFAWLAEHFPFISPLNIVFCGDKSIIAADLLVDDTERHFARFGGQGVLFAAPHNTTSTWPVKVNGWDEARTYLDSWEPSS